MFTHEITYVDFNGTERTENFHFHMSKPEAVRLQAEIGQELKDHIETLVANQNLKELLDFLEKIILNSYGKKTSDGRSFIKNQSIREEFEHSQAYAEFFEELLMNPELAAKFGEGIVQTGESVKNQVAPKIVQE